MEVGDRPFAIVVGKGAGIGLRAAGRKVLLELLEDGLVFSVDLTPQCDGAGDDLVGTVTEGGEAPADHRPVDRQREDKERCTERGVLAGDLIREPLPEK